MAEEYSQKIHDHHYEQYQQCVALCESGKYPACTVLGMRNLITCTVPRYLQLKTLILLICAERSSENDWSTVERLRNDAERKYKLAKRRMAEKAVNATAGQMLEERITYIALRRNLDNILLIQAYNAPCDIARESITKGKYPGTEGDLTDALYKIRLSAEDRRFIDNEETDETGDGNGEKKSVHKEMKLETNDVKVTPKDTAAVDAAEREDREHVQDITQRLRDIILSDQAQEASSGSANKSMLMTEEEQFAGTTKKKPDRLHTLKSKLPKPIWKR